MTVDKKRNILIVGAIVIFVLLFFAPKVISKKAAEVSLDTEFKATVANSNLDVYLSVAEKAIDPNKLSSYRYLISTKQFDSLIIFWDKLKRPDLASFFAESKAKSENNSQNWLLAGKRYYNASQFVQDKSELPVLFQCALRCFNKTLGIGPNNEAKILKASCYLEGAGNPMDGVAILKEVEKSDSNNVQLQLTFAFFSVKSGQLDKAIQRFRKVLRVDSNYIEAYLHLADIYERQNNTEMTIDVLQKYLSKTSDETSKIEINKYIQQLKINN